MIVVAILLGLALGWRGGAGQRASAILSNRAPKRPLDSSVNNADRGTDSAVSAARAPCVPAALSSMAPASAKEVASDGLLVTQDGKVIFRLPPSEEPSAMSSHPVAERSKSMSTTRLIHRVEPNYPPDARAQHIEGAVVLDVKIGEQGAVQDIAIVEGNSELAEAAVEAVRRWRYRPLFRGRPSRRDADAEYRPDQNSTAVKKL